MDGLTLAPALLPREEPLDMPVHSLREAPNEGPNVLVAGHGADGFALRRWLVLGGALLLTAGAAAEMSIVVGLARWTVVGLLLTLLFAGLFFFIILAFTSGLAGFIAMWRRDEGQGPASPPCCQTASNIFHPAAPKTFQFRRPFSAVSAFA